MEVIERREGYVIFFSNGKKLNNGRNGEAEKWAEKNSKSQQIEISTEPNDNILFRIRMIIMFQGISRNSAQITYSFSG